MTQGPHLWYNKKKEIDMTEEKNETQEIGVLNKFSLDLVVLAEGGGRHYVDGLHVTSEFTEVTNGHYAMRISNVQIDPGEYPLGPNGEKLYTEPIDIIVPTEVVKRIQKNLPTKIHIPILKHAVPGANTKADKSSAEFIMYDLTVWSPISFKPDDARYPNIDAVMPKDQPELEIGFNPEYMIKICQQFKKNGVTGIRLSLYGPANAMKLEGKNTETGQDIVVILMPVELKA